MAIEVHTSILLFRYVFVELMIQYVGSELISLHGIGIVVHYNSVEPYRRLRTGVLTTWLHVVNMPFM